MPIEEAARVAGAHAGAHARAHAGPYGRAEAQGPAGRRVRDAVCVFWGFNFALFFDYLM